MALKFCIIKCSPVDILRLQGRGSQRERERESELQSTGSLPKHQHQPELGQTEA